MSVTIGPRPVERTASVTGSPPATSIVSSRSASGSGGAVELVAVGADPLEVEVGDIRAQVREPPGDRSLWPMIDAGSPENL